MLISNDFAFVFVLLLLSFATDRIICAQCVMLSKTASHEFGSIFWAFAASRQSISNIKSAYGIGYDDNLPTLKHCKASTEATTAITTIQEQGRDIFVRKWKPLIDELQLHEKEWIVQYRDMYNTMTTFYKQMEAGYYDDTIGEVISKIGIEAYTYMCTDRHCVVEQLYPEFFEQLVEDIRDMYGLRGYLWHIYSKLAKYHLQTTKVLGVSSFHELELRKLTAIGTHASSNMLLTPLNAIVSESLCEFLNTGTGSGFLSNTTIVDRIKRSILVERRYEFDQKNIKQSSIYDTLFYKILMEVVTPEEVTTQLVSDALGVTSINDVHECRLYPKPEHAFFFEKYVVEVWEKRQLQIIQWLLTTNAHFHVPPPLLKRLQFETQWKNSDDHHQHTTVLMSEFLRRAKMVAQSNCPVFMRRPPELSSKL